MASVTSRRRATLREPEDNTAALLGQAWDVLGKRILDGVQAAGHPIRMAHSMVFVHIDLDGIRLTQLAERASMTPQAMGELVDDLVQMGYVAAHPRSVGREGEADRADRQGLRQLAGRVRHHLGHRARPREAPRQARARRSSSEPPRDHRVRYLISGSRGSPRMRSPIWLRLISDVPPAIDMPRCISTSRLLMPPAPSM